MSDSSTKFASNGTIFALEVLQQLGAESNLKENLIFSPFSIQSCLALAFAGSSGETAQQLVQGLKLVSGVPDEVSKSFNNVLSHLNKSKLLKIGNKLYVKEGHKLKSNYEQSVKKHYLAEVENLNFSENVRAAQIINDWVSERTSGKINNLISADALGPLTGLVLLNAIHFKGQWQNKFKEENTVKEDFWLENNKSVQVDYMQQKGKFHFGYINRLNCKALEMPYKDSDLSMLVLLPDKREGLKELVQNLKSDDLLQLVKGMHKEEVIVNLPKFKVEYSVQLKETLKKLGINKIFDCSAEFNNMLESAADLYASQVVHKAIIEVNEEGTEAAAATGMVMMMRCMTSPPEFIADHPFLYFIWNQKNLLFTGTFVNAPSA